MKLQELLQVAKAAAPDQLNTISDKNAVALLRVVFEQLKQQLLTTPDEQVGLAGFGQFRIRRIEKEEDGKNVVSQRITFKPAPDPARRASRESKKSS